MFISLMFTVNAFDKQSISMFVKIPIESWILGVCTIKMLKSDFNFQSVGTIELKTYSINTGISNFWAVCM